MIFLSNGHNMEYVVASGALAFDAKGWPWEWPLRWVGLIRPELFTVFIKTLTIWPTPGNLRWWAPWRCVRTIPGGGSVNKVGLTNPGIDYWCHRIAPRIDFKKQAVGGSIYGSGAELECMAARFNAFDIVALEVNDSCPNTDHMAQADMVAKNVERVKKVSRHPIIVKVSVAQDYCAIAKNVAGMAEAISLNSVPWEKVFPNGPASPLVGVGGTPAGGGVSGKPAQEYNWNAVKALTTVKGLPVIAPGIMEFGDLEKVRNVGASAYSFGAIHLPDYPFWKRPWTTFTNPCKPTAIVKKAMTC